MEVFATARAVIGASDLPRARVTEDEVVVSLSADDSITFTLEPGDVRRFLSDLIGAVLRALHQHEDRVSDVAALG